MPSPPLAFQISGRFVSPVYPNVLEPRNCGELAANDTAPGSIVAHIIAMAAMDCSFGIVEIESIRKAYEHAARGIVRGFFGQCGEFTEFGESSARDPRGFRRVSRQIGEPIDQADAFATVNRGNAVRCFILDRAYELNRDATRAD